MTKKELRNRINILKMRVVHEPELNSQLDSLKLEMSILNKAAKLKSALKVIEKNKERMAMVAEQSSQYGNGSWMTVLDIKKAVDSGKAVYWSSLSYKVIKPGTEYYIQSQNGSKSLIGLTWADGVTMNGKPSEFFIGE